MPQDTLRRIDGADRGGLSAMGALVRRHDRDRFQTALFAPAAEREALFALYAFNFEIARVRESVREPMLGHIRLQWWREAIAAAYGESTPRRHDIVEAVTAAIRAHGLGRAHFERLIDARERDLDPDPPATLAALEEYAEETSAPLILLALEALGAAAPAACEAARPVGIGYALVGLIRAMPSHAAAGRLWIPGEVSAQTGLDPADYAARRPTPALRRAVETLAAAASRHLAAAERGEIPKAAVPALLPARIAAAALRRLARAGFDPFDANIARDPLQPWRLALTALLRRF